MTEYQQMIRYISPFEPYVSLRSLKQLDTLKITQEPIIEWAIHNTLALIDLKVHGR